MEFFHAILSVLPALGGLINSLVKLGKSPAEAADIVIRDMTSRREQYEREKAEDEARLAAKHENND